MEAKNLAKEIAGKAIDSEKPFMFLGEHGGKNVIMITGDIEALKMKLITAMDTTPQLAEIFTAAVMVYKLRQLLDDFEPDCKTCPKRDDCPIKGDIETMAHHDGSCDAIKDLIKSKKEALCHGEGVAIGMVAASKMSASMGLLEPGELLRLRALLVRAGLPVAMPEGIDPSVVVDAMARDKKRAGGRLRFVLPTRLGEVVIRNDVPEKLVEEALLGSDVVA